MKALTKYANKKIKCNKSYSN